MPNQEPNPLSNAGPTLDRGGSDAESPHTNPFRQSTRPPPSITARSAICLNETGTATSFTTSTVHTITEEYSEPQSLPMSYVDAPSNSRLYFAYGSNLSTTQMSARCPSSTPVCLARIYGWKFIINSRGYANIVPDEVFSIASGRFNSGVYGVLYEISEEDEANLDRCEGVPWAYEKVEMTCWAEAGERWECDERERVEYLGMEPDRHSSARRALVYVDRRRTVSDHEAIGDEYIHRMNRAIKEAVEEEQPLPKWYVDRVLRLFIPSEEDIEGEDE